VLFVSFVLKEFLLFLVPPDSGDIGDPVPMSRCTDVPIPRFLIRPIRVVPWQSFAFPVPRGGGDSSDVGDFPCAPSCPLWLSFCARKNILFAIDSLITLR
jgi:hypothetical protein